MPVPRVFAFSIAAAVIALLAVLLWPSGPNCRPPELSFTAREPAGIIDDRGAEMWLVTLGVSNTNDPLRPENCLCLEYSREALEARVANRWFRLDGVLPARVDAGRTNTTWLLVPAGADRCRVSLRYTGWSRCLTFKGSLIWFVERLPLRIRSQISYKFWRWAGYPHYRPSSRWGTLNVELPFPPDLLDPRVLLHDQPSVTSLDPLKPAS